MENDLLHLLRGVVLGEIPLYVLLIEEELLPLVGLFLGEQMVQVFTGQGSRWLICLRVWDWVRDGVA